VPTGGLAYHPTSTTTIKASVAKGFRSPTIRELYLWTPANANLQPERMMNYEIGVLQNLLNNRVSLELTLFKANGDNLIQTVMSPTGIKNENTGKFSNTGVEFTGVFKPISMITINTAYSYISMKEPIVAAPKQQLSISGTYKWNRFNFYLSVQHIQNLYTQVKPEIVIETYTLLNSRISYIINNHIDVFIKGENLTNKKYYINYGYPMPRIIVFGGINLHL